ncbi:MAG: accessory factor UbiK family protein [Burkholderiaceae bacterium]|nr:MAG: accessory factor UbiK family protein [Burkholderiaceae bacterium]
MDTKASPLDFLQQIQQRISAALQNTPAQDIEKNLRALLQQSFGKLDLVTREEFELQRQLVERLRSQVQALETRVAELEQKD